MSPPLTPDQEAKLRALWYSMGKLIGLDVDGIAAEAGASALQDEMENSTTKSIAPSTTTKKRGRFGLGRGKPDTEGVDNEKHGGTKAYQTALAEMTHSEMRMALWNFSKCDDPDSNLCRYLRARKWVVHDALVMLVSTIHWRNRIMRVDDDVLLHGEEAALEIAAGEREEVGKLTQKVAQDLMKQARSGKAFVHGRDRMGRPACFIRVKLHKIGAQSEASLERLIVYMIETARFMLNPPELETVCVVFDMEGFGMSCMDYVPLKLIIKVFEANYPESLGTICVHRAPWIFQSVWGMIKGWLDPVVASKIQFTKDGNELSKVIDPANIPRDIGGEEDWEYEYPPPVPGENERLDDHVTRDRLEEERIALLDDYEAATIQWVLANGENDDAIKARRKAIAKKLHTNYWQIDPYIRSRSMLDREGLIGPPADLPPVHPGPSAPVAAKTEAPVSAPPPPPVAAPPPPPPAPASAPPVPVTIPPVPSTNGTAIPPRQQSLPRKPVTPPIPMSPPPSIPLPAVPAGLANGHSVVPTPQTNGYGYSHTTTDSGMNGLNATTNGSEWPLKTNGVDHALPNGHGLNGAFASGLPVREVTPSLAADGNPTPAAKAFEKPFARSVGGRKSASISESVRNRRDSGDSIYFDAVGY